MELFTNKAFSHTNSYHVISNFKSANKKQCMRMDKKNEIRVLEVGCGAGNNLWFAAREGLLVSGIDASSAAINYAKNRFREENLEGDFRIGDFTDLPFDDHFFDLVIDRAAITSTGLSNSLKAIKEVNLDLEQLPTFFPTAMVVISYNFK